MYTYRYRLYPKKSQIKIIEESLEICRKVYNKTLEAKIKRYELDGKTLTLYDTNKILTSWKETDPDLKKVFSQVLCKVQEQVDFAYSRFFAKQKRFPRFKGKGRLRTLKYSQFGYKVGKDFIYFSKIGNVKCKFHRLLLGKIKTVQIIRNSSGKFYVNITTDSVIDRGVKKTGQNVGVDFGVRTLATLSDGSKIENPKYWNKYSDRISSLSRRHDKNKTKKNRRSLDLVYEKITNCRDNFCNKESNKLIRNYDVICFEKLDKDSMLGHGIKNINKAIKDACWGRLTVKTSRKAESAGKTVVLIEPDNTSKICSRCGVINDFPLKKQIYNCGCGLSINRDLNASINILRLGLQSLLQ